MKNSSDYYNDASYEVYLRGGNPDRLDPDKCEDDRYNGRDPKYTAERLLRQEQDERDRRKYQIDIEDQEERDNHERDQYYKHIGEQQQSTDDLPF